MLTTTTPTASPFLAGGGEMGQRTRDYDWSASPLGTPDQWPQSLKTTVGLLLHSAYPMLLLWGDDLICFYNDACQPSLGSDKHPALGKPARAIWPESWAFIGPLLDQVRSGGEPVWFENQLVPIHRNGRLENVYWTFSYSPAYDDAGQIGGVFVTCIETTEAVLTNQKLSASEARLRSIVEQTPLPTLVLRGNDLVLDHINDPMLELMGQDKDVIGKPLIESMPELEGEYAWSQVQRAYHDGIPFDGLEVPVSHTTAGVMHDHYYNIAYRPLREDSQITGVLQVVTEVTQQVLNRRALEEREQFISSIIDTSVVAQIVWEGDDMVIRTVNERMLDVLGRDASIIGKPFFDAIPELIPTPLMDRIRHVYATGENYVQHNERIELIRYGKPYVGYYDYTYQALKRTTGEPYGILSTAVEVTQQVLARQQIEESEAQFRTLIEEAPVATALYMGRQMIIAVANDTMLGYLGKTGAIIGKPFAEVMPELKGQGFFDRLDNVFTTGQTYQEKAARADIEVNGVLGTSYFDYTYKALRNAAGDVYAILVTALDVTTELIARKKLEESEEFAQSVFFTSPVANAVFVGDDMVVERINEDMLGLWGCDASVVGQPFLTAKPELVATPLYEQYRQVLATGETYTVSEGKIDSIRYGQPHSGYYNFSYKALTNSSGQRYGIICTAVEVTEQVLARQSVEASEARYRSLIEEAPVATALYRGPELVIDVANEAMIRFYGKDRSMVGKPMRAVVSDSDTDQAAVRLLEHIFATGEPVEAIDAPADLTIDGVPGTYYFDLSLKPLRNVAGEVYAVLQRAIEVTQQVLARQQVQEAEETLRGAIAVADMGTWQLDMTTGRTTYDDKLKHLFEFTESFIDQDRLYNPIHERDRARLEEAVIRAANPETGGYLDEEYTVTTQQTGRHRIVRAQAKMYFDASGQPHKMVGTMRDITEQRETQLALEQLVQQRTEELRAANEELSESNNLLVRSNENLQKFAYVASHDLQEPLRKIQSFGDLLKTQYADVLSDGVDLLERMQSAASRMSILIRDLLNFSRISTQRETNAAVPLNKVVSDVQLDLELAIADADAVVNVASLPTVQGDAMQLGQLFQNLLANALKFRHAEVPPHITISSRLVAAADLPPDVRPSRPAPAYHRIDVQDNGIGFDPRYVDRIFQVFQRLHSRSNFAGTGIGLAICEKVATNHGGAITAHSQPGGGATFSVYLPR